ncbi:MAG: outer membrane beta-barrel protein [Ignavibacteriaceae bacterium]|nr:outer membrane beta-barrel protein [Ignavibacteriaceae bacterium]
MKKFTVATTIIFAVMFSLTVYSQSISIGVGGGLTNVVGSEDFTNKITEDGLAYSTEWNMGVVAKLGLPIIPITPRAFILYHSFSGSDNIDDIQLAKGTSINSTEISNSQSLLSVGLGVQYGFIPIPVGIDPYLAIDLMYNNFGELEVMTPTQTIVLNESLSRFGLGLGVGAEVSIIPMLNLDVLVSYQMMNLVGKEDGESSLSILTLDAFLLFSLL